MWTVIYMTHDKNDIERLKACLEKEGILTMTRPINTGDAEGPSGEGYELLVPDSEVSQAHEIIIEESF